MPTESGVIVEVETTLYDADNVPYTRMLVSLPPPLSFTLIRSVLAS